MKTALGAVLTLVALLGAAGVPPVDAVAMTFGYRLVSTWLSTFGGAAGRSRCPSFLGSLPDRLPEILLG